ncbi:hypothetical protein [Dactylosporangium sp. NPDC000521]|uniref:hypothetical protein n=1 Tax=Dactylosporangium sp. NPDC000521 TaxID=3363975 RepID=UPI0036CAD8C6
MIVILPTAPLSIEPSILAKRGTPVDTGQHSAAAERPGLPAGVTPPAAGTVTAGGETSSTRAPIRRRWIRLAVAGGGVTAIVVAGLVAARTAATGGGQGKLTDTGIASCARHIAEGVVTDVSPSGAGGGWQVTIQVEASLKGADVGRPLTYHADEPSGSQVSPGTRVVVIVSRFPDERVQQYVGADVAWARDWMAHAVPLSHDVPCDTPG